jgi:hypothetical protein
MWRAISRAVDLVLADEKMNDRKLHARSLCSAIQRRPHAIDAGRTERLRQVARK